MKRKQQTTLKNEKERKKREKELLEIQRYVSLENCDEYTVKRFAEIIMMVRYITGLSKEEILENMKKTIIYQRILEGNECFLYESYPANLVDMIKWWKKKGIPVLSQITVEQVSEASIWISSRLD